jgi:hypothetical protein
MPDLYIFKAKKGMADPVALQDHNVIIHFNQSIYYKRVDFLEGLQETQVVNLGAVAANNQVGPINVPNLEMPDNEFGIFRWYPIDYAQYLLFHPAGLAKGQLRNFQFRCDPSILTNDPNLVSSEIGVWENNRPSMIAINGLGVALAATRIKAIGYRFHTIKPEPMTRQEKLVVKGIKDDPEYASQVRAAKTDGDILVIALKECRLPATHIWCSGRGAGD